MVNNKMPFCDYATVDWFSKIKHICGNFLINETKEAYDWVCIAMIRNGFHVPLVAYIDRDKILHSAI